MHTIYVKTLKHAAHTVFCVEDGQKTYYDPQFNRYVPYSSGQQIKRSILEMLNEKLDVPGSPTTFFWDYQEKKKDLSEGEVISICHPGYPDQLFGGWMKAGKGGKEKTLKRRSPLSISAMRSLHPQLAGIEKENLTFDRTNRSNNKIIVRNQDGRELSIEEVQNLLSEKPRSLARKWIPNNDRATGLFVMDLAIDLRRLFSVSLNPYEPEIDENTESQLREAGWQERSQIFGPCLIAPEKLRKQWIPALADAILDWRITSNQARTFSLMETLAVSISMDAHKIAGSIRAKLSEEEKIKPIIEESMDGVDIFVTLSAAGFIPTNTERADAIDLARKRLIELMSNYDYEH